MVSTCRSIARWLTHASGIGGYLIRWFSPPKLHGSGSVAPEVLEPRRRQFGKAHGVLDVAVAEIGLQRPRIVPLVG